MNTSFKKTGIGRAENGSGSTVEGAGRELMRYEHGSLEVMVETYFSNGKVTGYLPSSLPSPLPFGFSAADVFNEIRAGVAAAIGREVLWK